jgi:hypothetical protein
VALYFIVCQPLHIHELADLFWSSYYLGRKEKNTRSAGEKRTNSCHEDKILSRRKPLNPCETLCGNQLVGSDELIADILIAKDSNAMD